mgnify:CR=1 FL=1
MSESPPNDGAGFDETACAVDLEESDGRTPPGELGFDPETTDRPILVWDGTCGFCRRSVEYIRDRAGGRIHYVPYQHVHRYFGEIDEAEFERAVHLVEPDGLYYSGAEAVYRALDYTPDGGLARWSYERVPGFARLSEWGYRQVAENRPLVSKLSRWLVGGDIRRSRFRLARWLFLRGAGLTFLVACVSLFGQIFGLFGTEGIVPAVELMERIREANAEPGRGESLLWRVPTLFWWVEPTNGALSAVCLAGGAASLGLVAGVSPPLMLGLVWVLYLSLATVGGPFLGYQWDILLLEVAFLGLFIAPRGLYRLRPHRRVSRLGLFVFHWLAFRLMFMSGVVKLTSQDPVWRDGTALQYHFWTQPLPSWTAYYVHHLPDALLWVGTQATFAIELALPFLVFAPRRPRRLAAWGFLLLQGVIFATGNYGFFNILTAVVCLLLIDDQVWRRLLPDGLVAWIEEPEIEIDRSFRGLRTAGMAAVVVFVVGVTTTKMLHRFGWVDEAVPSVVEETASAIGGFRTLNNYGLFADMTVERPEIIVQGSRDGREWKRYDFAWKPDGLGERPRFVEPHMPRLDWQMWFQALRLKRARERSGRCGYSRWFTRFQKRLLEGKKPVVELLDDNPFPDEPPAYVRTVIYDYRFTRPFGGSKRWWRRSGRRSYCPTVTLKDGELRVVRGGVDAGG